MIKTIKQRKHRDKIDFHSGNFYYDYKSKYSGKLTQKEYSTVLKLFFELVISEIVVNMFQFILPGIGLFYLLKKKQDHKINKNGELSIDAGINWPATKKLWAQTGKKNKKVYYLNEHTFGFRYKIYWDRRKYNFINKRFYTFIPSRKFKQFLFNSLSENVKPLNAYIL